MSIPAIEPVPGGDRPFWSVMVPCYNRADLLARTLESILAQDPGPETMQIEVVDDASTYDDPASVVERLGEGRIGFFKQTQNVGAPTNFTTCVRRSRGEWVHILHCDDVVRDGFYRRYRAQIEACPEATMVGAQTIIVDESERFTGVTPPVGVDDGYMVDAGFTIATTHPLAAVSAVVSRRAYEAVGGFHPALAHTNDWEMWTRVASAGRVAWVNEPFGLYRSHPGSDSNRLHRSTAYLDECLEAIEILTGYVDGEERRRLARRGARRAIGAYAVAVGIGLVAQRRRRLAIVNAVRAARIDPSIHTWSLAAEVVASAVVAGLRDRAPALSR
jgi:GT2 family glycosyltransferase